jgi:EmrB/QacA subfamily drug resistance transporter
MPASPARERIVPMVVACGLFMENLDSTVLATSLPAIAASLEVNPLRLNLAITSYLLSLAVFIPISGWVADRWGARNVFRAAILVFVTGSICCGLSTSLLQLVGSRILQGIGGAMMVPVGRLVILRSVPKERLVRAMAYLTIPALIGPVIGPPLGGFITTYASWRWIFWINVPIGVVGFLLVTRFIDDLREPAVPPLDLVGFALAAIGVTGLMFGFETVGRGLLPVWLVGTLFAAGLAAALLYRRHAQRVAAPILDLALLRLQTFRAAVLGGSLFRVGIGALPFLLPLMLQLGFGLSPFHSGLVTFAAAAGALTMKFAAAPIIERVGFKRVLLGTALISALSIAVIAWVGPGTPLLLLSLVLLAGGFFRSLHFTSINVIAYADVEPGRMSRATSFMSTAQQLSISMGVGTGALILHSTTGPTVEVGDFWPAFLIVALISASSVLFYARLPSEAGAALAGRRRPDAPASVAGAASTPGRLPVQAQPGAAAQTSRSVAPAGSG